MGYNEYAVVLQSAITHFNYILVLQLSKIFHFAYGRHVQAVLELANLDLLDGDLSAYGNLATW